MSDRVIPDSAAPATSPAQGTAPDAAPSKRHSGFSLEQTFAAFKYRNYRLWFAGQLVSLVGTWMQTTAQGYLIFELTKSPVYLGYVAFASGIPSWLFTLYGGVIADRMPRRSLLIITQTLMMVLAFILAALTFTNLVQPWHIVVLAFCLGVANAFDAPARQSFVLEMVEREDLTNAIALNAGMFNSATAVGPAVAGITYALFGPAWCFTINALSFLAVIAALFFMRVKPHQPPARKSSALEDIKEGLSYIAGHPIIRTLIMISAATSLFGLAFATLIPAWAVTVLGGDSTTNGYLQSARGVGSLIGAFYIASLGRFNWRGKLLTFGSLFFPALLIIFAFVRVLPFALVLLIGVGFGFMTLFNVANSLVQTQVEDRLRGRVMGVYTLTFFGFMPIGGLLAGAAAEQIGEPNTVLLGSLISIAFALFVFFFIPRVRALE